jgi:hypothetical protein
MWRLHFALLPFLLRSFSVVLHYVSILELRDALKGRKGGKKRIKQRGRKVYDKNNTNGVAKFNALEILSSRYVTKTLIPISVID